MGRPFSPAEHKGFKLSVKDILGRFANMIMKTIKIVGILALVLVFLVTIAILLGAVLRDEKLLSPWGTGFFIIASGSMEPEIPTGSIVLVRAVAPEDIKEGDVVTYFVGEKTSVVTHRIEEISIEGSDYVYTTRGDANNVSDKPFGYDMVIGRVSYTVPGSSFIIRLLGSAKYVAVAIIAAGLMLCFTSVSRSTKKQKALNAATIEGAGSDEGCYNSDEAMDVVLAEASADDQPDIWSSRFIDEEPSDVSSGEHDIGFGGALDEELKEVDSNEVNFNEFDEKNI